MSINLTKQEVRWLQQRYYYLMNYISADVNAPIDPVTYVDSGGDTLLHIAASAGDIEGTRMLLRAGMNPNELGDMGYTPLHYSKEKKHDEVSLLLIQFGARLDIRNEFGKLAGE
jgi:ankyrin repeat protein